MTKTGKEKHGAQPAPEKEHKARKGRKGVANALRQAAEAEETLEALNDRHLRLQADFDNFRKRTLREKSEIYKRANEELMEELLPVLDHLELALSHVNTDGKSDAFIEGVRLVGEQLLVALAKFGLAAVDASGNEFDPNLHEAVSHLPSDAVAENHVMEQTRRGYLLGGKLLRPAQVVVSSGELSPPATQPPDVEEE